MKKQIKTSILCALSVLTMSACSNKIDCDIEIVHCHEYIDRDNGIKRYIESEKEYIGSYDRTEKYIYKDANISYIAKNKFCFVKGNEESLKKIMENYSLEREAYVYGIRYGYYYGYDYGYNPDTEEYEYFHGRHYGYYYDYEWEPINPNIYTTDKVRDIYYTFRFYKMSEDGKIKIYKDYNSLDEVEEEYCYFRLQDLVIRNYSKEYYMTPDYNSPKLIK